MRIPLGVHIGAATTPEGFDSPGDYARRIYEAYVGYPHMTPALAWKIVQVAENLEINPFDLANLIHHESRFNPRIQNPHGPVYETRNGARNYHYLPLSPKGRPPAIGLIQFLGSTLEEMGFESKDLWYLNAQQQMDLVEAYLRARNLRPNAPVHQLHMAVFYPAYVNKPASTPFPAKVIENNPGILNPAIYTARALDSARLTSKGALRGPPVRSPYLPHPDEVDDLREQRTGTIADNLVNDVLVS